MRAVELKGHLSRARGEEEKDLRKELMRVAQLEDTRAVFKCGTYEVLKLLASTHSGNVRGV